MKESINSKPSSILKKCQPKYFEVNKSLNGFLNSDTLQYKHKKILFEEPIKFDRLSSLDKSN